MIFPNTGPAPRAVLGARQVLLISVQEDFFEEGCDYHLRVEQCVLRTYLQPYKCMLNQFDFVFRFITTYPAITILKAYPNDMPYLGVTWHANGREVTSTSVMPVIPLSDYCIECNTR